VSFCVQATLNLFNCEDAPGVKLGEAILWCWCQDWH